jgi:hypothetical protein
MIAVANSANSGTPNALSKHNEPVKQLVANLQSLNAACSLVLQQPGAPPTGMATPQAPPASSTSSSAAKLAVDNAKYKADITRANLDVARKCESSTSPPIEAELTITIAYENASKDLVDSQKQVTETLAEITRVSMENVTLESMLPVLKKAVATFTLLRAQFSKITEFFVNVASLIKDVMKPSVDAWAKALDNTINKLAGVSLSSMYTTHHYRERASDGVLRHHQAVHLLPDDGPSQGLHTLGEDRDDLPVGLEQIYHACAAARRRNASIPR